MKTILCFGDSNTYGYKAGTGGRFGPDVRWPSVLAGLLGEGFHVVEEGLPGRTAAFEDPTEEGLCGSKMMVPLMSSHAPVDTLVVMLGTNDSKERFAAQPAVIARGMGLLLEKALHCGHWAGAPDVLLVAPAPISSGFVRLDDGEFGAGADAKSEGLAAAYKALSEELGIRFFDAATVAAVDEADGIHLSTEAHLALAGALAPLLK